MNYLKLAPGIKVAKSYQSGTFNFLNLSHRFDQIDWNYPEYGMLWTYNLNYFDFLNQDDCSKEEGLRLINDFIDKLQPGSVGLESYPLSLRGMNWIKFLSRYEIRDQEITGILFANYRHLIKNIEYHLLGNHLLENSFSLFFAACFFNDKVFYRKATHILRKQLDEQILSDGAHFELSPMYHQLMLFRLLDCINILKNNPGRNQELLNVFENKARKMLLWLNKISFGIGKIPLFNDAANAVAFTTGELIEYSQRLGISIPNDPLYGLKESGYRKYSSPTYEILIDAGMTGPDYNPGHAHADIFNFELYVKNFPFIVDTGTSTYELNERRLLERSTGSHNTVKLDQFEQSEMWASHRVGKRARVRLMKDTPDEVIAEHNGYKGHGVIHQRRFNFLKDSIVIEDEMKNNKKYPCFVYIHFYPGVSVSLINNGLASDFANIHFEGLTALTLNDYFYSPEFNKLIPAKMVEVQFKLKLKTIISF